MPVGLKSRVAVYVGASLLLALLGWHSSTSANGNSGCQLPRALEEQIGKEYRGFSVVSSKMLRARDRTLYRAEHRSSCPGLVRLDFYGTGADTYGLSLAKREEKKVLWKLLVATARGTDGNWQIREVDEANNLVAPPAIWKEPAGKYEDVHGKEAIEAKHAVLLAVQYQAWAIAYAWTGERVGKVWVSD